MRDKLAYHVGDHVVLSPEGAVLATSPGTESSYPRPAQLLNNSFSTLTTRQLMVEFYLLTFPRFPLRKKEHKFYFGKNRTHDFRASRCAGYLLGHSGDELLLPSKYQDQTLFFFLISL